MNGLMLHCGANAVDRNELARLPVPEPMGSRHCIRPFIDDIEVVTEAMTKMGVVLQDEAFGIKMKDAVPAQFFALFQVRVGVDTDNEFALMVGMRGSYNQTLTRALAVGSRVFVCDNLAFSGEIEIATKQTTNINQRIPQMLEGAVAHVPALVERQDQRFDAYRNTTLTPRQGDAALIELVRRDALNPSQIGRAVHEWDEPSHEDHTEQGYSAWRLHNAVTEAIKPTNPERMAVPATWERTRKLTTFLDEVVGL